MSQVIITFDLVEYFPSDFNFSSFSFIINSDSRDFEQEISFQNKSQIKHKLPLPKKDIKYSIKVTKNNSLIGISELIIPFQIFQKREKTFDKTCNINTTDSIKRVLFGNSTSDKVLKISIHSNLEYKIKDKDKKDVKDKKIILNSSETKKNKEIKGLRNIESFSPKNVLNPKKNINITNNVNNNIRKHNSNSSSKPKINIKLPKNDKTKVRNFDNNNIKDINNTKENKNALKNKNNEEIGNISNRKEKNESFIDDELNKEEVKIKPEFYNFMQDFKEKYPLEKLDSMNNINELKEYSKNTLSELLKYQFEFYTLYKNSFETKKKFKNLMIQYNEKYRNTKKEINKLDEMNDICEINEEILNNNNKENSENIILAKKEELNNFKELFGKYNNKKEENKNEEKMDENTQMMEKSKTLLINILQNCANKYGPINKIFTPTNSTESDRVNILQLANKYNLPIKSEITEEDEKPEKIEENDENNNSDNIEDQNGSIKNEDNININEEEKDKIGDKEEQQKNNIFEGKITKWEYVSTEKPDKIDKKLELYLKYFYSKRAFPVVIFKKTSTNNYEYGKQKVMIKIEGDTFRVRYVGGYLILDKFIELNAVIEDKKMKKINEKNNSTKLSSIKKKDNKKKAK